MKEEPEQYARHPSDKVEKRGRLPIWLSCCWPGELAVFIDARANKSQSSRIYCFRLSISLSLAPYIYFRNEIGMKSKTFRLASVVI